MARYHVTPQGNPGRCSASEGRCPFGADAPHYPTQDEARSGYEASMAATAGSFAPTLTTASPGGSLAGVRLSSVDQENQEILALAQASRPSKRVPGMVKKLGLVAATLVALSACGGNDYYEREGVAADSPAATATAAPEAPEEKSSPKVDPKVDKAMEKAKDSYAKAKDKYDSSYKDRVNKAIEDAKRYSQDWEPPAPSTEGSGKYDRDAFKHWSDLDGNNCDTRQDILQRDMTNIKLASDGCTVMSGTLQDPYTGKPIAFVRGNNSVDIDHVVPLSWAWQHGANEWSDAKREKFANDGANLLAVQASANRSKGDQSPAEWMPINQKSACSYGETFLKMAQKYELKIDNADISSVDLACK